MTSDPSFEHLLAQGMEASRENRAQHALELFARASACQPASALPHFLLGSEHASAGDIAAAEAAFVNALLLAPDFTLARYQLGLLQFTSQRPAQALLTWQPLFALPPADPLAHFVRGFEALARDSFGESLQHLRQGLTCNDINQAMAADVQRVVEAVERLVGSGDGAAAPARHVLLTSYGSGLH